MHTCSFRSPIPVPVAELFTWHERPGALERMIPPWEHVEVIHKDSGVREGARVHLRMKQGLLSLDWIAQHGAYKRGAYFTDTQVKGPFSYWKHTHRFHSMSTGRSELEDQIEYSLPGGKLSNAGIGPLVDAKLRRTFAYRHRVVAHDLACAGRYPDLSPLRIAVAGPRGLLDDALCAFLRVAGHHVLRIVAAPHARPGDVLWDTKSGALDLSLLENTHTFVNLWAGHLPRRHWSQVQRKEMWEDRVHATRRLVEQLSQLSSGPQTFINASSMTYYGDTGERPLTESSEAGEGFLSQLYHEREQASYELHHSRVINMRLGMVLSPKGGHLSKILLPFRLGLGGVMGSGRQHWSWISLDDFLYQCYHCIMTPQLVGPVNLVSPNPVRNYSFVKSLGRLLFRPTWLPMPESIAHATIGQAAEAFLLSSRRGIPR
ncbi:MAG: TIGR01777 family oxidoreductase, partial [Chlamydiia bacterium]|nr:TIGR01777 family oxidoreductase [Chlamydiia bacterium]